MGWFAGRREFDRTRQLEAAARARARRRRRRAVSLYRSVLAREPRNVELHARLGPLLAETGQSFDAWISFRAAAKACQRQGQPDRALAIYREAALYLPREYQVWQAIAHLQHQRGEPGAAVETLLEGSRHLRARWARPHAIYLLRRAREIEPWNFEVVVDLARLLAGNEQADEAGLLLAGLGARSDGDRLRRVRAVQLGLSPGLGSLWRWLRARPGKAAPAEPARPSPVVPLRARSRVG
jgi:tetratricopeptide (TPR) repeat protein